MDREHVHTGSHAVCLPDSDALNPVYQHMDIIGLGAAAFDDPTTMVIIKVCSLVNSTVSDLIPDW